MASIEYAIDENGNKIYANKANRYSTYICPYCLEDVDVRKGNVNVAYFAHSRVEHRTPKQRICPGYKGNEEYSSINNRMDKMHIDNGGIPLYLCSENDKFELRAYFPKLSDKVMAELKINNAKIYINTDAFYDIEKAEYYVDNVNFYKVDTIKPWIYVSCKPKINLLELRRKWLWGIRGIDIEKDIYHSNKEGGYRVALKSNIFVGKIYKIMFNIDPPNITGIEFHKIGNIHLKKNYLRSEIIIYIFTMKIKLYTEEVRSFIESKGYKLLDNVNELIPVWPPAVFEGNNLKYVNSNAFFLHIDKTKKERVFCTLDDTFTNSINIDRESRLLSITTNNRIVGLKNNDDNSIDEIKYTIVNINNYEDKKFISLDITISDSNGDRFNFVDQHVKPPKDGKLFISSNLPFVATVLNGNYVISSSNMGFEKIRYFNNLIIDSRSFGFMKYKYNKSHKDQQDVDIDFNEIYLTLYKATKPYIKATLKDIELLNMISQHITEDNIQLYRIVEYWIKLNKIPFSATEQLNKLRSLLGGTVIEQIN